MQSPGLATLPLGPEGNESIRYERQGERIAFPLKFCPYQSYLLTVEDRKEVKVPPVRPVARKSLDIRGNWNFSIDRMNTLRLGTWNLQVEENPKEQSVECQPIINQISDAAIPLPVKLKDYFGCPKEMEFPPLKCRYRTTFQLEEDAADIPVLLVMEPGSIEGEWQVEVNGHCILPEGFQNKEIYLPTNLAADISSCLKIGINEIRVWVETNHVHDGLVNPLYLCGNFSVFKKGGDGIWKITPFVSTGKIRDLRENGLPFYAGTIQYKSTINLDEDAIEDGLELSIREPSFQDAVELYINGYFAGVCAWSPYIWRIDQSWLKPGSNEIRLHVSTTLLGLFEGQYFDPSRHRYMDI